MPVFYDEVEVDVTPLEFLEGCTHSEREELVRLLRDTDLTKDEILSNRTFLKELCYKLKYVNSDNLEFVREELNSP